MQVCLVDFAYATTGRDSLPHSLTSPGGAVVEASSGTGYQAEVDPEMRPIFARFFPALSRSTRPRLLVRTGEPGRGAGEHLERGAMRRIKSSL